MRGDIFRRGEFSEPMFADGVQDLVLDVVTPTNDKELIVITGLRVNTITLLGASVGFTDIAGVYRERFKLADNDVLELAHLNLFDKPGSKFVIKHNGVTGGAADYTQAHVDGYRQ